MLRIETSGSWRDMGCQLGKAFGEQLHRCLNHYASWLVADTERYTPGITAIQTLLKRHMPGLLEETHGIADAIDVHPNVMLGYRFFNSVRHQMKVGCSDVFLADSDRGPLLGRNCDLSPNFDPEVQICQVARPDDGMAFIQCSYLGVVGGCGLNAHGMGEGGASAHTRERYSDEGLPNGIFAAMLYHRCKSVADARKFAAETRFLGKPCNMLVADKSGDSAILELAPGNLPVVLERKPDRHWQACTNFFLSGKIPIAPELAYLKNAYARYGRINHVLADLNVPRTLDALKQLLIDIAQPGFCVDGNDKQMKTAYTQIMELRSGRMHITPGHPAEHEWETVSL